MQSNAWSVERAVSSPLTGQAVNPSVGLDGGVHAATGPASGEGTALESWLASYSSSSLHEQIAARFDWVVAVNGVVMTAASRCGKGSASRRVIGLMHRAMHTDQRDCCLPTQPGCRSSALHPDLG